MDLQHQPTRQYTCLFNGMGGATMLFAKHILILKLRLKKRVLLVANTLSANRTGKFHL